ncbi:MAG: hypothetical protein M1399_06095 [Actinobacteria bacterium]|nr:hypothetical protein [Actinomycetota bacterium]MCL5447455.1 hypothetical protein [Actinomycetota bacterium]
MTGRGGYAVMMRLWAGSGHVSLALLELDVQKAVTSNGVQRRPCAGDPRRVMDDATERD